MSGLESSPGPTCTLRVLVVENNRDIRADHEDLLRLWNYVPVLAQGTGLDLIDDAVRKARLYRCQVALVDMRLLDDYDPSDDSGLDLAPKLLPTVSIIVSGIDDRKKAVEALRTYKAANFVGKQDGPAVLKAAIEEAARQECACPYNAEINWSDELTSAEVMQMLFPTDTFAPPDEADEVISRLFREAHHVSLAVMSGPLRPNAMPSQQGFNRDSAIRRHSFVCKTILDTNQAALVVKIARKQRIEREIANYNRYVKLQLRSQFVPVMHDHKILWDIGAVAYRFIGNADADAVGEPRTFRTLYRDTSDVDRILAPLEHFFDDANWGLWFHTDVQRLNESLFSVYDRHWDQALSAALPAWLKHDPLRSFPDIDGLLPDPTVWLSRHYRDSTQLRSRQAVTHGDLQGENLFVDQEGHAWPIDFERTGPGPILCDFVEIIHDIVTHLSQIKKEELSLLYELAVAICAPRTPDQPMRPTQRMRQHPKALIALQVIWRIQQLARERAWYTDQRELLWGLLLNSLYVATIVPEHRGRYFKTLLLASVICGRLSHWDSAEWPPPGWPPVDWPDGAAPGGAEAPALSTALAQPSQAPRFTQGHALLIGVGSYPKLQHSVDTTANEARALGALLTDPAVAAYPAEQVRVLHDAAATRANVLKALDALAHQLHDAPKPTVLLFFAGHGKRYGDGYLLLPADYDPADKAGTAIDAVTFRQKVDAIARHAQKVLIVLNCCYAGGLGDGVLDLATSAEAPPQSFYAPLAEGRGRVIISSARPSERAGAESSADPRYTVFGAHLIDGLRGAAAGASEHVMLFDLVEHLQRQVPADARAITDPATSGPLEQHPELYARPVENFALTLRPLVPAPIRGRA